MNREEQRAVAYGWVEQCNLKLRHYRPADIDYLQSSSPEKAK
jgi:hypothetical protein